MIAALLAWAGPPEWGPLSLLVRAIGWILLTWAPGFSIHRLATRRPAPLADAVLAGLVLSPVLVAVVGALGMWLGAPASAMVRGLIVTSAGAGVVAVWLARRPLGLPRRRDALLLLGFFVAVAGLIAFLPFTREWWRVRSDAWFHAAVVAQIDAAGVPPEDPYFAGIPLQYMWWYHVTVSLLSHALHISPFWTMAVLNVHALAMLTLAAFRLAGVFRDHFAHRFAATATLLLSFNGAFWLFLPLKLVRAFLGEVRGWDEVRRTFSLHPLDYDRVCVLLNIYYNPEFFLDKFMVATAFGLALGFMTAAWYSAVSFLKERRTESLIMLAGAMLGMLGFHSLVGFVTLAAFSGGALLAWLTRRGEPGYRARDFAIVVAVAVATLAATGPYLHEIMRIKEREQLFPLSISFAKTVGIGISCAVVLVLSLRQRAFWRDRRPATRFFLFSFLSLTLFCLLVRLPGPNTYDKLGYFVFIPLSIPAGYTLADRVLVRRGWARWREALAWTVLFFLPVNGMALAGAFATPSQRPASATELRLSDFVREHTPREAVIIDDHERVTMLVTAPRRYYAGMASYAEGWGYPKLEMSRRLHVRRALYVPGSLDGTTLDALASIRDPVFVVVRPEHRANGAAVTRRPDLFSPVYDEEGLQLMRVDADACRAAASVQSDRLTPEELIRESGL